MTNKEIERAAALLSLTDIAKLLREIGRPLLAEEVDRCAAALTSPPAPSGWQPGDALLNPVNQVYFRAGLLACREYMARFVEALDPTSAQAIRASWWPSLGADPGAPRKMEWSEVTEGEFGTPSFRCKTAEEVSPSIEALPVALGFLELPPAGGQHAKDALPPQHDRDRMVVEIRALIRAFADGLDAHTVHDISQGILGYIDRLMAKPDALPPAPDVKEMPSLSIAVGSVCLLPKGSLGLPPAPEAPVKGDRDGYLHQPDAGRELSTGTRTDSRTEEGVLAGGDSLHARMAESVVSALDALSAGDVSADAVAPAPEASPAKPQPRHLAPRCPRCVARTHVRLVADASHAEAPEDVWQCEICLHEFTVSAADASPAKETR